MPRLRNVHLPTRRIPREQDPGFLISIARAAGLYTCNASRPPVQLRDVRTKATLFTGSVPEAVAFVRSRRR